MSIINTTTATPSIVITDDHPACSRCLNLSAVYEGCTVAYVANSMNIISVIDMTVATSAGAPRCSPIQSPNWCAYVVHSVPTAPGSVTTNPTSRALVGRSVYSGTLQPATVTSGAQRETTTSIAGGIQAANQGVPVGKSPIHRRGSQ